LSTIWRFGATSAAQTALIRSGRGRHRAAIPLLALLGSLFLAGPVWTQEAGVQIAVPPPEDTGEAEPEKSEGDPCDLPPGRELLGLDWTRRALFDTVCSSAMWIDGFFGDLRYDEAAPGVRGRLSLGIERREDAGVTTKPRFRVRVPLPNLNKRLSIYFEREDETRTIEGRNEDQQAIEPISTSSAQDSTQVGFAYRRLKLLDEVVEFRLGLRAPRGELDYYGRVRYRYPFWRTASTQWRIGETLYWRHSEGWGETTQLDFDARLSDRYLFRWYNSARWSQTTEGVDWRTGTPLYRLLRGGKVVVIEPNLSGQTGNPYAVTSYGLRGAYRQTLGRPWLFGEIYLGEDRVKPGAGQARDAQFFAGFILEIAFDGRQRLPQSEQEPTGPLEPGETSPVQ
jgi:hypothetical protein